MQTIPSAKKFGAKSLSELRSIGQYWHTVDPIGSGRTLGSKIHLCSEREANSTDEGVNVLGILGNLLTLLEF